MDINTLLDFVEELLNMYGYETRRNVGIVGGKITTAPLEKETGTLKEKERIPKKTEAGVVYKADILAEKKDIERPFGRIVVRYKRGPDPVQNSDVNQINAIRGAADAYTSLLLTATGYTEEARIAAETLASVTILTPEKVHTLLGKAMTKEKWWFNAPAYPICWDYEKVRWKLKWYFEKILHISFDCIWFFNKELAYEPYWKFSYHVSREGKMHEGYFGINAFTGELDVWFDSPPEETQVVQERSLKDWFIWEAIHTVEFVHMVPRTKIKKPKLPKGINYVVYRPAMEKHEAKLAAIQWISYVEGVPPEEVVITGRELIYYPWWKFYYFYRPIIKNAWQDTEWTGFKMSAVYGDIFNTYKSMWYKRDIIYYYMEKSLIKLFGRDRYVRFMRKITLGICSLWWNYHLVLKPWYVWLLLLFVTGGTIYAFITATWGLSLIFGILLIFIFMGPGYGFLYLLQDYLKKYPVPLYPHPQLTRKKWEKELRPITEADQAMKSLETMEEAGKLSGAEKRELERLRRKQAKKLIKKAKKRKWK